MSMEGHQVFAINGRMLLSAPVFPNGEPPFPEMEVIYGKKAVLQDSHRP